ncbi:hypothetical protein [Actinacidiphila sp. bgisy160]|uniref:hypothetical protein n=1 Tax=Actinacidiphila sp. bgisy160 TaxID=3413796 RepID=UPI003D71DE96
MNDVRPLQPLQPTAVNLSAEAPAAHLGALHLVPTTVLLPNGQTVTGYAQAAPPQPDPAAVAVASRSVVSGFLLNFCLAGVGFLAFAAGLHLAAAFVSALADLISQLMLLAAVLFGAFVFVQMATAFRSRGGGGNRTNIRIKKAVIKRNKFSA